MIHINNDKKYYEQLLEEDEEFESSFQFNEHYFFEKIIGNGAFGTVIEAREKLTNRKCAIKVIK